MTDKASPRIITEAARETPVFRRVDVAVVGGGPAGFSAAIAAARAGAEVLLIERNTCLGGTGPMAFVIEFLSSENLSGVAKEVVDRLGEAGGAARQIEPEYFNIAYDPEVLKFVTADLVTEAGAEILFGSWVADVIMEAGQVGGVVRVTEQAQAYPVDAVVVTLQQGSEGIPVALAGLPGQGVVICRHAHVVTLDA